ncbi:MAG: mandelate racemase [Hyphomicrobiaceae bacterium]|nr:mandelate racemase [Hyphomicrobiaceae bacterium]
MSSARISEITVRKLKINLPTPYKVSGAQFYHYEPLVVQMRMSDGREGFGETVIHKGYSDETPEGGLAFANEMAERIVGSTTAEARAAIAPHLDANSHGGSVLMTSIEMIDGSPLLKVDTPASVPLLVPVNAMELDGLAPEIEETISRGFKTLKVKVGFDVDKDLARVKRIQEIVGDRVTIRLDANRGFTREQGCRFGASLDPKGIELFEQPCSKTDWEANAAVAAVSTVPVMMDESIYSLTDIDRAAKMKGCGYVKVKLKKFGSLERLEASLQRIWANKIKPVLGDGVSTDLSCWLEACVARSTIKNAGEMNGFLKLDTLLFADPLPFENGAIKLVPGWKPVIDQKTIERVTLLSNTYSAGARSASTGA